MSRQLIWRALAILTVHVAAAVLVATRSMRIGLESRGSAQIVLESQDTAEQQIDDDTLTRTLEVLRRRVDQLDVSEPILQRSGDERSRLFHVN